MARMVDAAVLGGGLAGSSLAKSLAEKGWDTALLDRSSFPRHKVCGEFLSPESASTLQSFGLLETVKALRPALIERIRLIFANGTHIELPLPSSAFGISRYSLDTALHQAAQQSGARLQTGTTVTAVHPIIGGYVIETKQGGEISALKARTVIAAWGANQRSDLPGYRQEGKTKHAYMGVKSHFQGIKMEPVIELYFFPGGYLGLCPIEGGLVNASALLKRDAFMHMGKSILAILDAAVQRNSRLYEKLKEAAPVAGTQVAVAPVHLHRKLQAWDTIPLAGDALSMIPPLCGDGMSMALRSAAICAPHADRFLQGDISLSGWQQAYASELQKEFEGPLRWGSLLQRLFEMPLVSGLLPSAARLAPRLAEGLVQATRLKAYQEK